MSTSGDYMLIRVDLQGARQAAAEATVLKQSIGGVTTATTASTAASRGNTKQAGRMAKAWGSVARAAKYGALGLAAGTALLAVQGKKAVDSMLELTKDSSGLTTRLGLQNKEASRWAAIAKARDIASTQLGMSFKTLGQATTEAAKGEETYLDLLKQVGVNQRDAKKGLQDSEWLINQVAEGLGNMDAGMKRTTIASKLLGRGYQTVLPLFAEGKEGMKEQLHWADRYNVAIGKDQVDANMKLVMAQRESKVATIGLQNVLAAALIPALTDGHEKYQDFVAEITDPKLTNEERISLLSKRIKSGLSRAFDWVLDEGIPRFAEGMGQMAPKVAGAFVKGFINANALGKILMGWWLISKLTGKTMMGAVGSAAGSVARKFGTAFTTWFAGTQFGTMLSGYFGKNGKMVGKLKPMFTAMGRILGRALGVAIAIAIPAIIWEYREQIKDAATDVAGWIGGKTTYEDYAAEDDIPTNPAGTGPPNNKGGGNGGGGGNERGWGDYRSQMPKGKTVSPGTSQKAGKPSESMKQPIILQVDGKEMAKVVVKHGDDAEARR
jgi:hypothetical protein